jgi:hypothetical protein
MTGSVAVSKDGLKYRFVIPDSFSGAGVDPALVG